MESEAPYKMHHSDNGNGGTRPEYEVYETVAVAHIGWIYNVARRQLRDTALAEDAAQAVLLALWQKRRYIFNRNRPIGGWLAQATYYACSEIRKSERRRKNRERKVAAMRSEEMQSVAEAAEDSNALQLLGLDAAMHKLSTGDRDVLVARFFQNQSARQMAQAFNISEAAAEKRITRAVIKLRGIMAHKNIVMDSAALAALLSSGAGTAPNGLLAKVLQGVTGKAPISLTAAHAARSIAFHSAHIPAIVGAAAVALAVSVAAVAPIALQVKVETGLVRTIPGAPSADRAGDKPTCFGYDALVSNSFVIALRHNGQLISGNSGDIQTYSIPASTVRSLLAGRRRSKQITLDPSLHWMWYSSRFPQPKFGPIFGGILSVNRQFQHQQMQPSVFVTLFPEVRGHILPNSVRLHLNFSKNSATSVIYSAPKAKLPPANFAYVYNRTLNIKAGQAVVLLKHVISYPGNQWYSAVVLEVQKYPKEELPILHQLTSAALYLREGPATLERQAAVAVAWRRFARRNAAASSGDSRHWTKSLPGGVRVTLQSISSGLWPLCSWAPNGQPRPSSYGNQLDPYVPARHVEAYLLVKVPDASAGSSPGQQVAGGASFAPSQILNRSVLHIGSDTGPWKILGTAKPTKAVQPLAAPKFLYDGKIFGAYQFARDPANPIGTLATPASVSMWLALPQAKGFARQVVAVGAIDRKGHLVAPYPGYFPTALAFTAVSRIQISRSEAFGEYTNENIPVSSSNVKRYVWITRPRYWVTFRGFALKPSPLPSVVFAMSEHGQEKSGALGTPTTAPSVAAKKVAVVAGRATPAELWVLMEHYLQQDNFNDMNQLYWAPTALDKRVAKQANNAMAAMFGFGLWPVAKKRFGAAQLAAAKITKSQLGWPGGSQKNSTPIRWKITGRFAAPVQTPGQIVEVGISPSAHAPLIREHGLWYINFGVTSAKMRQVQAKLQEFKKYYSHTGAYKAVLTELQAGKIKDAYALRDALAAALKKYSTPRK